MKLSEGENRKGSPPSPWRGNWRTSSGRGARQFPTKPDQPPIQGLLRRERGRGPMKENPRRSLAISPPGRIRVLRTRQLPTDHCHAVRSITRAYQHDHRRDPLVPVPPQEEVRNNERKTQTPKFTLDRSTHISCGRSAPDGAKRARATVSCNAMLGRAIVRRLRPARALRGRLPSRLIPHRHRPRAELQPAHELQVDILR